MKRFVQLALLVMLVPFVASGQERCTRIGQLIDQRNGQLFLA